MTDIRTLLHDAAPRPAAALDVTAIRSDARRRRFGRAVAWLVAIVAALGVGLPVGNGLLVTADRATPTTVVDIGTLDEDGESATAAGGGDDVGADQSRPDPGASGSRLTPATAPRSDALPTVTTLPLVATTTTPPPASDNGAPAMDSCKVDNTGLLPGERRTCRFTATRTGGWRFGGGAGAGTEWHRGTVAVTRNGETAFYRSNGFYGCGDDIIQPGDVVSVDFAQAQGTVTASAYVAAGYGWGCTEKE